VEVIEFTYHIKDIDAIAASVLEHIVSKTILFNGAMGAGKTTFINALLKAMQSDDVATSPTFWYRRLFKHKTLVIYGVARAYRGLIA